MTMRGRRKKVVEVQEPEPDEVQDNEHDEAETEVIAPSGRQLGAVESAVLETAEDVHGWRNRLDANVIKLASALGVLDELEAEVKGVGSWRLRLMRSVGVLARGIDVSVQDACVSVDHRDVISKRRAG